MILQKEQAEADVVKLFVFDKFDDVRRISHVLDGFYSGRNDLYRDASSNKYYLVAHKSEHTRRNSTRCAILFQSTHIRRTMCLPMKHFSRSMVM